MRTLNACFIATVLGAASLALGQGCTDKPSAGFRANDRTGVLQLSLHTTSSSGQAYRLRDAIFYVTGAADWTFLSEDYLNQPRAEFALSPGEYSLRLSGSWRLERAGAAGYQGVEAELISVNPIAFSIANGLTTEVSLRFAAELEIIELGTGQLELGIDVEEASGGAAGGGGTGGTAPIGGSGGASETGGTAPIGGSGGASETGGAGPIGGSGGASETGGAGPIGGSGGASETGGTAPIGGSGAGATSTFPSSCLEDHVYSVPYVLDYWERSIGQGYWEGCYPGQVTCPPIQSGTLTSTATIIVREGRVFVVHTEPSACDDRTLPDCYVPYDYERHSIYEGEYRVHQISADGIIAYPEKYWGGTCFVGSWGLMYACCNTPWLQSTLQIDCRAGTLSLEGSCAGHFWTDCCGDTEGSVLNARLP